MSTPLETREVLYRDDSLGAELILQFWPARKAVALHVSCRPAKCVGSPGGTRSRGVPVGPFLHLHCARAEHPVPTFVVFDDIVQAVWGRITQ